MSTSAEQRAGSTWVVIPAYQAAQHLGSVVSTLVGHGWLVLVVDDGSTDGTAQVAAGARASVLNHAQNMGKGAALQTAFRQAIDARVDGVVTMDADGQHDPECVSALVSEGRKCPVVIGSRRRDAGGMPSHRRLSNCLTSWIMSIRCRQRIHDSQSGFRYISRDVLEICGTQSRRYQAESELLIRAADAGFRIGAVPVPTIYGSETSHIHPFRDTWNFVRLVVASLFW